MSDGAAREADGPGGATAGGARRRRAFEGRSLQHQVRLTAKEREVLHERADARGVSVSRLLVDAALADGGVSAGGQRAELVAALREHRRLLATVANNANQLAHTANISGNLPAAERLAELVGEVDRVCAEVRAITRRVA